MGLDLTKDGEGPLAMTYDMELGWIAETLGPTSAHWKRKACAGQTKEKEKVESPVEKKRSASTPTRSVREKYTRSETKKSGSAGKWRCGD